jgi:dTMP kinase
VRPRPRPTVSDGHAGRLIAVEGIDGCGKSTQARLLASRLDALLTFEPGATPLGRELRRLVLTKRGTPIDDRTEALLMVADRAQHVAEVVGPALDEGRWVVTDRFSASTLAYQGYGRGLPLTELRTLVDWASGGLTPDLTILLDIPVEVAETRRRPDQADRIEAATREVRERMADGYRRLAADDPTGWVVIDGTGSVDDVAAAVWSAVRESLDVAP